MKWEEPFIPTGRYSKNAYEGEAAELRAHPGRWALIAEFPVTRTGKNDANKGRHVAHAILSGKYVAFRPEGSFEAVSRKIVDEHSRVIIKVFARYVGGENNE